MSTNNLGVNVASGKDMVYVGSRLPMDMTFYVNNHSNSDVKNGAIVDRAYAKTVVIKGQTKSESFIRRTEHLTPDSLSTFLLRSDYGVTAISREHWEQICKQLGEDYKPFRSKAIVWAKSEKELNAMIVDLVNNNVKTGLEGSAKQFTDAASGITIKAA